VLSWFQFSISTGRKAVNDESNMARLPKMPKGIMARIRREEAKLAKKKAITDRKRAIEKAKKRLETLKTQNRKI
jgi:hypothetical protein